MACGLWTMACDSDIFKTDQSILKNLRSLLAQDRYENLTYDLNIIKVILMGNLSQIVKREDLQRSRKHL